MNVSTEKQGSDMITTMVCNDSGIGVRHIRASISFNPGVSYKTVINAILTKLSDGGMPIGDFLKSTTVSLDLEAKEKGGFDPTLFASIDDPISGGYNVEGNLFEELQKVCKAIYFRAYIVLGKIYVEPILEPNKTVGLVTIDKENVKGTIKKQFDSSSGGIKSPESKFGILVNTFLNGRIRPNQLIKVSYGDFGTFKISQINHKLNYEGNKWDTIIKAIPVGA